MAYVKVTLKGQRFEFAVFVRVIYLTFVGKLSWNLAQIRSTEMIFMKLGTHVKHTEAMCRIHESTILALGQYKLKRCSNKECWYVMFKGTMTKWPVQKLTQGTTQNTTSCRNRHLDKLYFCVFRSTNSYIWSFCHTWH